jgi:hypothetical protein
MRTATGCIAVVLVSLLALAACDGSAPEDPGSTSDAELVPDVSDADETGSPDTAQDAAPDAEDDAPVEDADTADADVPDADASSPPPETGRFVLAHWMVRMGRNDANARDQADYEVVLEEMADFGVDALVVYWDSFDQAKDEYAMALDAAEATGVPIVWGTLGYNDDIVPMIIDQKDRPGLFRDADDRIVISGFHNAWSTYDDGSGYAFDPDPDYDHLQELRDGGVDFAYWPDLPYHATESRCERAQAMGAEGAFVFKYDSNVGLGGGVSTYREWLDRADEHLADCEANGVGTMPPILPYYAAQPSHNHMMFESYAYVGIRAQWMWAINNEVDAVQIVTVNDFNEHTYLQSFGEGGPLVGTPDTTWWAGTLATDHSGFGKFMKRYADWYRTGVEPAITEDQFLIAYRLHPRTAKSWDDLSQAEQQSLEHWLPTNPQYPDYPSSQMQRLDTHAVMEDSVQLVARLTERSTVTLEVGSSTLTETLDPGEHILVITGEDVESTAGGDKPTFTPAQFGYPSVEVTRGGQTILDATAPLEITEYIAPGKFNYYAAELEPGD